MTEPQNSGFTFGANANFSEDEKQQLTAAFNKITTDECRGWFEKRLAEFGPPGPGAAPYYQSLDAVLGDAKINKYEVSLTAEQMGISDESRKKVAKNYDNKWTSLNVANGYTNGTRVWLMPVAFWNNSTIPYNDRDLTGIIIHELFHVAGYGDDFESRIKELTPEIKRHCSKTTGNI